MARGALAALFILAAALCLGGAAATVYFQEEFDGAWHAPRIAPSPRRPRGRSAPRAAPDARSGPLQLLTPRAAPLFRAADSWAERWHTSTWKQDDGTAGEFKLSAGKWYGDEAADRGLQTGPDSKFFATWAAMDKEFDNAGKTLVLQARPDRAADRSDQAARRRRRWEKKRGARGDRPPAAAAVAHCPPPHPRPPPFLHRPAVLGEARAEHRLRRRLHQAAAHQQVSGRGGMRRGCRARWLPLAASLRRCRRGLGQLLYPFCFLPHPCDPASLTHRPPPRHRATLNTT